MKKKIFRIGSRTSPLALVQVEEILRALKKIAPRIKTRTVGLRTVGDRDKKTPISDMEGTDFFTREIDRALINKKIDFAVHSAKDLPEVIPDGIEVAAVTRSVDPYDVLVSKGDLKLKELPKGARVGTSSERRKAQLRAYRPDLKIVDIRGTMQERLDKLKSENLDAVVIAGAGLVRLGLGRHIAERIPFNILKPNPLQGSLAVTIRKGDPGLKKLFKNLDGKKIASYATVPASKKGAPRKRILVTGTSAERFKALGDILHVPMIEIKPVKDLRAVDAFIGQLPRYDGVIFTSKHAVRYFLERLKKKAQGLKMLRGKMIVAIGKTTAARLADHGLVATRTAKEETADGIVRILKDGALKGKRFLVPRSELSNDRMVAALRRSGAAVDTVTVYRNVMPKTPKVDLTAINEIIFTSPSTVKNFFRLYQKLPSGIKIKAIGPVTKACLRTYGIQAGIV